MSRPRWILALAAILPISSLKPTRSTRATPAPSARRRAGAGFLAALAPLVCADAARAASNPNLGNLDPSIPAKVIGLDEDAPFRAALGQIKILLDGLGVEGAVPKGGRTAVPDGPIIKRPYTVGLTEGTDRLQACPADNKCLSGTRGERKFTPPFVFFDQKGDAVGNLLELLYSAEDAEVLLAKGNFFNGAGVYVLAEIFDRPTSGGTVVHDLEFQFLPGVLENIVECRILAREGGELTSEAREKELLGVFGKALGWLPLDSRTATIPGLTNEEKGIIETSAVELKYREQFEGEMEKADKEIRKQMQQDRQKIEELKKTINQLLDSISLQEDRRYDEFRELRSRTARARAEYEEGVNKRIGGVANDGRYAQSQRMNALGNSFGGMINKRDDVMSQIQDQAVVGDEVPVKKKRLFGL